MYFRTFIFLKVTHHGSNTSSTPLFLSRFPPRVAVIQCGADNPYGHPTPETLDRLQRAGAKVFRNDEDGDVIATIKDQELKMGPLRNVRGRNTTYVWLKLWRLRTENVPVLLPL